MFGKRLKKLREEKELTQGQLGKLINLSQQTIGHYEVSRAKPDLETIQRLAEIFNVTTDYLLGHNFPKQKIKNALSDDPELSEFWQELSEREDLKILFRQAKDMSPEAIRRIIRYIKIVEDKEASEEF